MKIFKIIITIIALLAAALLLFWRFAPPHMAEYLSKNAGPARTLLCQYMVKVQGDAMVPIFTNGQRITFSKCVEERDNIAPGTVILYERPSGMRISVIRERIADTNGILYRVSQEARQQEVDETRADRVIAIYVIK